jgi:hypothetical protein
LKEKIEDGTIARGCGRATKNRSGRIMNIVMRIFKTTIAIGLLLLAALTILGEYSLARETPAATWHQHVTAIVFIGLYLCGAYLLIRKPVDSVAEVYCPRCMAMGGHALAPEYTRSVYPLAWHFGGFLLSIFYSGSKKQRFNCRECGELFHAHTATSRGYLLLFLLLVALIVNLIWSEISEFFV